MTDKKRAELIEQEADKYADDSNNTVEWSDGWEDHNDYDHVFKAFQAGAKWADNNPKLTKKDFMDQAKEFLKDALTESWGDPQVRADMSLERFLWEFDKWMA